MLAVTGAAAALLLFAVLPFAALLLVQGAAIADSKVRLAAAQEALARRSALEVEFRDLSASAATAPGLLSAGSAALAQAQLQSAMKSVIEEHGGVLLSAQILPPDPVHGFDAVAIQYDLTVPLSRLRGLLYAVETHTPYLFIAEAEMQMPANWSPDNAQLPDPALELRWTVRAYRWSGRG
jgi:hypothetical protein